MLLESGYLIRQMQEQSSVIGLMMHAAQLKALLLNDVLLNVVCRSSVTDYSS